MADVDELYGLKNLYYLGSFQQVINDATNPAVNLRSDLAKLERKVYLHRAYIGQNRFNTVLQEISSSEPVAELKAVRYLAQYLAAVKNLNSAGKEAAVTDLTHLLGDSGVASSALLAVLVATALYHEDRTDDAMRILSSFPKSLEALGLTIQIYLKINRVDLAKKEIASMKTWADDATMAQLIEAWANLFAGTDDKSQESFYAFEELGVNSAITPKLLVGKAVARIQAGKFEEAEGYLLEALNRNSSDPETLVNMIVCSNAMGKPAEVVARFLNQLKESAPEHKFLQETSLKEAMFDRVAQRFSIA